METSILHIANRFDKTTKKTNMTKQKLQKSQRRKLKTHLAKSVLLKLITKKIKIPKS